jgi:hypothetical protein
MRKQGAQKTPLNRNLTRLADLLTRHRQELLDQWRQEVRLLPAARDLEVPTLNDHIPNVLEELSGALTAGETRSVMELQLENSPRVHGTERFRAGFDIVEVVAEYNIIQELVQALAEQNGVDTSGDVNQSRVRPRHRSCRGYVRPAEDTGDSAAPRGTSGLCDARPQDTPGGDADSAHAAQTQSS